MFIYKITVTPIDKIYIGLDTGPEYKRSRWKYHCRMIKTKTKLTSKLYSSMQFYGIENCTYEVVETGYPTLAKLAIAEIEYIKLFDSYHNGLNGTAGGDGLGRDALYSFSEEEIEEIRHALGEHWRNFNSKRWKDTTPEERRKMLAHWFEPAIIAKRVETQKEYYANVPGAKERHSAGLKRWIKENPERAREVRIKNGALGAEKVSKKVLVERENGMVEEFKSVSDFQRKTKQWMCTIREKSAKGEFYNGYRLKDTE